jgi:alkyl hydroperoxide reductase subunit AhpC
VDSYFSHLAWTGQDRKKGGLGKMNIPLLADLGGKVARSYGCLIEEEQHTSRATFIIDPKGILRHASFNDPPVGTCENSAK